MHRIDRSKKQCIRKYFSGLLISLFMMFTVAWQVDAVVHFSIVDTATGNSSLQASPGDSFTLDIRIDTGTKEINGYSIYLTFDDAILEVKNQPSPFIQKDFLGGGVLENDTHGDPGNSIDGFQLDYTEANLGGTASGSGVVAQLEFQALTEGTVEIGFDSGSDRNTAISLPSGQTEPPDSTSSITITVAQGGGAKSFTIFSGDQQTGFINQDLAQPLVVLATENTQPLVGTQVTFSVLTGGGKLQGTSLFVTSTDANGQAQTTFTLGPQVGTQQVEVTLAGYSGDPLIFTATAEEPPVERTLTIISGNNQSAPISSILPDPLIVQVMENSQPASGIQVRFQVSAGGGTLHTGTDVAIQTTDATGYAQANLTLGSTPGENRVQVSLEIGGVTPVEFHANALSTTTNARLSLVDASSGSSQLVATVGDVLSLEVRLFPEGDQVTGAEIYLSFDETFLEVIDQQPDTPGIQPFITGAALNGTVTQNDAQGHLLNYVEINGNGTQDAAMATFQLKTKAVIQQTRVLFDFDTINGRVTSIQHTSGVGEPVTEAADLEIRAPGNQLILLAGDGQTGTAGTQLPSPLVVAVQDPQGNLLSGVSVTFTVQQSNATFENGQTVLQVLTDENGQAQATLVLGTAAGVNNTLVEVTGTDLTPVTFRASTTASYATQLVLTSGNQQTGATGSTLPQPLITSVFDAYGNPVADVSVFFQVAAGDGWISSSPEFPSQQQTTLTVKTDTSGKAQVYWTLSGVTGNKQLTASAEGLAGSPVSFSATATVGAGTQIEIVSGQQQTGIVGTTLPDPLVVRVTDSLGDIATEALVTFSVVTGDGQVNGATNVNLLTDANGHAQVTFILGTQAGQSNHQVKAELSNGENVVFVASANAGDPSKIQKLSGDSQTATIQQQFGDPLVVQVTDVYGNVVPNVSVRFRRTGGSGQLLPITGQVNPNGTEVTETTDASGHAAIHVIAGTLAGSGAEQIEASILPDVGASGYAYFSLSVTPGAPDSMVEISGNGQTGNLNSTLPAPFIVAIRDIYNNPVPGVVVQFVVTEGDGILSAPSAVTNETGQAAVTLTLGTVAGTNAYTVEARVSGIQGSPVRFLASAIPGGVLSLSKLDGDEQAGTVGKLLPLPLVVRVADSYQNPISDVEVSFQIVAGDGFLTRSSVITDADGKAESEWTLGTVAGDNHHVLAQASGVANSVSFTATALPEAPSQLAKVQGDDQTGIAGSSLPDPFVVRVLDRYDNPVSGADVTFTVTQGDGQLPGGGSQLVVQTDDNGQAATTLTLGNTVGTRNYTVQATIANSGIIPVEFFASATAGAATAMQIVDGDAQTGVVGQTLPLPLQVQVLDASQNPVAGESVRFEVRTGEGHFANGSTLVDTTTDSNGYASISFIVGTTVGVQNHQVRASLVSDPRVSVLFAASATHGSPTHLVILDGNHQTAAPNQVLATPLTVELTDSFDNPIPGVAILFQVITGGGMVGVDGSFYPTETVFTDDNGHASVSYKVGSTAGENIQQVDAFLSTDSSRRATFSATVLPGSPASLVKTGGDGQTATVTSFLPEPFQVAVHDTWGNSIPDTAVTFRVITGDGGLHTIPGQTPQSVQTAVSDNYGVARIYFTLGTQAGDNANQVEASLAIQGGSPVSPVLFSVVATADPGTMSLQKLTTGTLTGTVNTPLPTPLTVGLFDQYDNPVEEIAVKFETIAGDGHFLNSQGVSVADLTVLTDATGKATATFVLGNQTGHENHTIRVIVSDYPSLQTTFVISTTAGIVATLEKVSGDDQAAVVDQPMPTPLVVRARDIYGNVVIGTEIVFIPKSGGVAPTSETPPTPRSQLSVLTDSNGIAEAVFIAGSEAGIQNQIIEVHASEQPQSIVTFVASALADQPAQLALFSGDQQTGMVGNVLSEPLVVFVSDRYGNAVKDASVRFEIVLGNGSFADADTESVLVNTDAAGLASVSLILGPAVGEGNNQVQAFLPGFPADPIVFFASAVPDEQHSILKMSGDHQIGVVGQPTEAPLVIAVRDPLGNPIQGATVLFESIEGGGTLENGRSIYTVVTDQNGRASSGLTLGIIAGRENNVIQVSLPDQIYSRATFRASAQPDLPEEIILVSGDGQVGIPGLPLPEPFSVRVVDRYSNPVPGVEVVFSIQAGGGSFEGAHTLRTSTDEFGEASALLTLATAAEESQIVEARVFSIETAILFQATGQADTPARLEIVSGGVQAGQAGQLLDTPLTVEVSDQHGNPISGQQIEFSVLSSDGSLVNQTTGQESQVILVSTDMLGRASTWYILGTDVSVSNQVKAALVGVDPPSLSVIFTLQVHPAMGANIQLLSGDTQVGTVGEPLAQPMVVLIRDQHDNIVPGASVRFQIIVGEGQLIGSQAQISSDQKSALVQANALGQAAVSLVLGPEAGEHNNIVLVSPADFSAPSLYFRASAQPGIPQRLVIVSGDQQEGTIAATLDDPLIVQVNDRYDNPTPGIVVNFAIMSGDGRLHEKYNSSSQGNQLLSVESDASGKASVLWTLGSVAEATNLVEVRTAGIPVEPVTFSSLSHAGGEVQMLKQSGDRQIGVVGQPLSRPIEIQLVDKGKNPIADAEVSFVVVEGGGLLEDGWRRYNAFTDEQGIASARWTLGNLQGEDNNEVQVMALDYPTPTVAFKASAESDRPYRLVIAGGNDQHGVANAGLRDPLTVIALDRYNNPVDDTVVTFEVIQGSGQLLLNLPGDNENTTIGLDLLDLYTDTDGRVSALYQLGDSTEPYTEIIRVTSPGLSGVQIFFNEHKNAPPTFVRVPAQQIKENEFLQFEVIAEDPEGDTLIYQVQDLPTGADFNVSSSPSAQPKLFRWRPGYADAGAYTVTFVAIDSLGNTAHLVVPISVQDQNRPPVLQTVPDQVIREGVAFKLTLEASDPDGDTLSYQVSPLLDGLEMDPSSGELTWQPNFQQSGVYVLTLSVGDPLGGMTTQDISFTVEDVPNPPTMVPIEPIHVTEGERIEIVLTADDPDGDILRFEVEDLPQGATFDNVTGIFRWQPDFTQAGEYRVKFTVKDTSDYRASQTAQISVINKNQAPQFTQIPDHRLVLAKEAELTEFTVLAEDPEQQTISLTATGLPSGAVFNAEEVENGSRGVFRWRPQYDQSGNYEIRVLATDELGASSEQIITVSILNVNRAPSILATGGAPPPLQMVVQEGELVEFEIDATDPDGETLTYTVDPLPADASVDQQVFRWQPGYQQSGFYKFNVTVTDPFGAVDVVEAEITVLDKNHPPLWPPSESYVVGEGERFEFFAQASDPDGDPLIYTASELPDGGHFASALTEEGIAAWFQWTPRYDQAGDYRILLTATDSKGEHASQTTIIRVQNVNQPPVIPQTLSLKRNDQPFTINLGSDGTAIVSLDKGDTLYFTLAVSDPDGDPINWQVDQLPRGASWRNEGTGDSVNTWAFEWTPAADQIGDFSPTFKVIDAEGGSSMVQFQIYVRDVDLPPVWTPIPARVMRPGTELRVNLHAQDPERLPVSYRAERLPSGATLEGSELVWIPATHQIGEYLFRFVARANTTESVYTFPVVVNRVPWDVNGDDRVDIFDLVHLGQYMGTRTDERPEAHLSDLNQDGMVDILDFVLIGQHFGERLDQTNAAPSMRETTTTDYRLPRVWVENSSEDAVLFAQVPGDVVGFQIEFELDDPDVRHLEAKASSTQWLWIPPRLSQEGRLLVAAASSGGQTIASSNVRRSLLTFTQTNESAIRVHRATFILADGRGLEWLNHPNRRMEKRTGDRTILPLRDKLFTNYPNPFNPETWIPYELAHPSETSIFIHDVQGRLVRTLHLGYQDAGSYLTPDKAAYWDGRNEFGERSASGVYLVRLRTEHFEATRRVVMMK